MPLMRATTFRRIILASSSSLAIATATAHAHTNTVAFRITDSAVTDCVGGTASSEGAACYDIEVFYGTWHSHTHSPEGSLAIFELTPEQRDLFANDPAANANVGTQVVGASAQGGTAVPFAMSDEFATSGTDYRDTALLPEGFVAGENFFYSGQVRSVGGSAQAAIFGTQGVSYLGGAWVTVDGYEYSVPQGVYGHQSAIAVGLGIGDYRFFYDTSSNFTVTWQPDAAINQAFFSIGEGGTLAIPTAGPPVPPIDTKVASYTVEQLNAGEVLPEFRGGTLSTADSGTVTTDFMVSDQNGTIDVQSDTMVGFSGVFSGAGGLTKAGDGAMSLTGENTFLGGVAVTGGTLAVTSDQNLGNASGGVTLNGGALGTASDFASGRTLVVGDAGGAVAVAGTAFLTWEGTIAGSTGELVKQGTGTLVLAGSNTLSGGFNLQGGTVVAMTAASLGAHGNTITLDGGTLAAGSSFSAGQSLVVGESGGTLLVSEGRHLSWTGAIAGSGSGGLTQAGGGSLSLLGSAGQALNGTYTVQDGTLQVISSFAASNLVVEQNGILGGAGVITADVLVRGELSPGNSPGTMTVSGNVTLDPTSTFTVEIDGAVYDAAGGAGTYDRTVVLGFGHTFTADGTIAPILRGISGAANNDFTPALGDTFRIVTTEDPNGIAGAFASLVQPADGLSPLSRFVVIYGADYIDLAVVPLSYGEFGTSTGNENAHNLGQSLDAMTLPETYLGDTDANAFLYGLHLLGGDAIGQAMVQASGEIHAFALRDVQGNLRRMTGTIGSSATGVAANERFWINAAGYHLRADETAVASSYRSNAGHILVGQHLIDDGQNRIGLAIGQSLSRVNSGLSGRADQRSTLVAGYYLGTFDAVDFRAVAGIARSRISTDRTIGLGTGDEQNSGKGNVTSALLSLEGGYSSALSDTVTGRFWARADGQIFDARAYSETGSGLTGVDVSGNRDRTLQVSMGYTLSGNFTTEQGNGIWRVGLGATRDLTADSAQTRSLSLHGADWTVSAAPASRTVATLDVGIEFRPSETTTIGVDVFGSASRKWRSAGAQISLNTRW